MRIVYCIDSINYLGGTQKVTVTKANALADLPGNSVWVVVADNSGKRFLELSPRVHFVNLGVNYYKDDWKSTLHVLKGLIFKRLKHRRLLSRILKRIRPDIVISVGTSEKNFIVHINGDWALIREIHSVGKYRSLHASSFFQRVLAAIGDIVDYRYTIKKYDKVVVLTKYDLEENWSTHDNVIAIPNPVKQISGVTSSLNNKHVVTVGRLVPIKGFSSLIHSFKIVLNRFPDWYLDIWGIGPSRSVLEDEINNNGLSDHIRLRGSSCSIQQELLSDSIFVCTSMFEGFGLTILEAMSCGLPVVSFDCDYGPREIIDDGQDGFLVPIGDEQMLAEKICLLIEDNNLRYRMGVAALEKSKKYSTERIAGQWMDLFEELLREKHVS
jgi:glycosyltransferase involved in cell wall biosynthesis